MLTTPGLYADVFAPNGLVAKAQPAAEQGTRTRVLAYNALNTRWSGLCARSYGHFVETDEQKAQLFVRNPASHSAPPDVSPAE